MIRQWDRSTELEWKWAFVEGLCMVCEVGSADGDGALSAECSIIWGGGGVESGVGEGGGERCRREPSFIYTYICTCIHTCICTYIFAYIQNTFTHNYIPIYIHIYTHTYINIYMHTYMVHPTNAHQSPHCLSTSSPLPTLPKQPTPVFLSPQYPTPTTNTSKFPTHNPTSFPSSPYLSKPPTLPLMHTPHTVPLHTHLPL